MLGGRFVLTIKKTGLKDELWKERFVAQEHSDTEQNMLVRVSINIRQQAIRIIVAEVALFNYDPWSQDVFRAYLQSSCVLIREVYILPKQGFNLQNEEMLKLVKLLYGRKNSGDYWHITMKNHLHNDLGMKQISVDPACFTKMTQEELSGIVKTYTDDTIATRKEGFKEKSKLTEMKFDTKPRTYNCFTFAGILIQREGSNYRLHQTAYVMKLRKLPLD